MLFDSTIAGAFTTSTEHTESRDAINQAVEYMRELAVESSINPRVRAFAIQSIRRCPPLHFPCQLRALTSAIRRRVRFVKDPRTSDLIQAPEFTLSAGGGDCDCLTTLFAACALAIGWQAYFVLGSARRRDLPSHVLPAVRPNPVAKAVPVEISSPSMPPGRLLPGFKIMSVVPVES